MTEILVQKSTDSDSEVECAVADPEGGGGGGVRGFKHTPHSEVFWGVFLLVSI